MQAQQHTPGEHILPVRTMDDENLCDPKEQQRLETAYAIYQQFCRDLLDDTAKARCRLIARIQIALRESAAGTSGEK